MIKSLYFIGTENFEYAVKHGSSYHIIIPNVSKCVPGSVHLSWIVEQNAKCRVHMYVQNQDSSGVTWNNKSFPETLLAHTNLILKYSWVIACSNTCELLKNFWNCHIQLYYSILCHVPHFIKRGSNTSNLFPQKNWYLLWIWHFDDTDIETQRSHSWTEEW